MLRRLFLTSIVVIAQLFCQHSSLAQTVEMPVYNDWRGDNCQFKSERPFFLIRDFHDLERFWSKANTGEALPGIDFERYMLLVWAPGASLFDHRPVVVERLISKEGKYMVLMDFKRKDTGGYWRRPFVATLLPLIRSGDIFIMSKHEKTFGKIEYKPLYTIWDMSGERQRPFEVAKLDAAPSLPAFIDHGKSSDKQANIEQNNTRPATPPSAAPANAPFVAAPSTDPVRPSPTVAAQQPVKAGGSDDLFPQDDLFGTAPAKAAEQAPIAVKEPARPAPTFEEDPLFGTEFDITF